MTEEEAKKGWEKVCTYMQLTAHPSESQQQNVAQSTHAESRHMLLFQWLPGDLSEHLTGLWLYDWSILISVMDVSLSQPLCIGTYILNL